VIVFACLRDKPLREMTQILFPIFDHVVLAPIHSPRATEVEALRAAAEATGVPSTTAETVVQAIEIALRLRPARIVVSGSLYLVAEARHLLLAQLDPSSPAPKEGRI
jgi:dihydrofolate synthase/folylpolyglutamate synthase